MPTKISFVTISGGSKFDSLFPFFGILTILLKMILVGTEVVEHYFAAHAGHKGIKAARSQCDVWLAIAASSMAPSGRCQGIASKGERLKGGRVVSD